MFRASPFKLNMFQRCPRQYKLHYVDDLARIYGKPRPYFTMGDHVHAALKDFFSVVPVEERTESRLEGLLREKWQRNRSGFKDREEETQWGEKALSQIRRFAREQDLSVTPLMVEDFHKAELSPKITLVGKIDRVDKEADGGLHIIDYKTGNVPEEVDSVQLHIYALILSREQNLPINRISYLYLEEGDLRTLSSSAEALDNAANHVTQMVETILVERSYPATLNTYCGSCDFLEICPRKEEILELSLVEDELELQ